MPFSFHVVLVAGSTSLFLSALLFALVRKMPRIDSGAGWWALSSLAAGTGYIALMVLADLGHPAMGEALYNMLFVLWGLALHIGGGRFLRSSHFEKPIGVLATATTAWLAYFYFVSPSFLPAALGASLFCGAITLHLGWLFLRRSERKSGIHYFLIGALWLYGLHWLDYPFLRPVEWIAPIGFVICSVVGVVINTTLVGLLINQFRTRMEDSEIAANNAARSDALTGLSNRLALDVQFEQAAANAIRNDKRLGLLFIDLDHFKAINDSHGHETGDRVLRAVAQRLRSALRDSDVVARTGGDEFVVILPDLDAHDSRGTETTTRKLLEAIGNPIDLGGNEFRVTASIGVSYFPDHGTTLNHLMHAADVAMYDAKSRGKDAYSMAV